MTQTNNSETETKVFLAKKGGLTLLILSGGKRRIFGGENCVKFWPFFKNFIEKFLKKLSVCVFR